MGSKGAKLRIPFLRKAQGQPSDRGKLLSRLLNSWNYGRDLATEIDFSSLLRAYRGWVYVCASRNATAVAKTHLELFVTKQSSSKKFIRKTKPITKEKLKFLQANPSLQKLPQFRKAVEIEEVLEHPFLDMMQKVNSFMNSFSLWELTELYMELCGNSYWYIVTDKALGIPQELWPVPPDMVKIIPDKEKFIAGYTYTNGMNKQEFAEEEIIHFKFPSPTSLYYGRSPLSSVVASYNIGENMNIYENALFSNMGRIEGAFETDSDINDAEFQRLKTEISQMFRGASNQGKSPLLDKGVHYKSYGFAPREMNYLQGRKEVKEQILNAYGQSLGMYDKDSTRANSEMADYTFQLHTIQPRLIRIEEKLNEKIMPRYDENLFCAFENNVPSDREYRLKEIESHLKTGYSSVNEERQIDNVDTVEWGDKPILPANMIPLGSAPPQLPVPGKEIATEEDIIQFAARISELTKAKLDKMELAD